MRHYDAAGKVLWGWTHLRSHAEPSAEAVAALTPSGSSSSGLSQQIPSEVISVLWSSSWIQWSIRHLLCPEFSLASLAAIRAIVGREGAHPLRPCPVGLPAALEWRMFDVALSPGGGGIVAPSGDDAG